MILNTIPIVRTSSLDPLYEGLPVVVVKEWEEVTAEKLAVWREELAGLFEGGALRERLSVEWWVEQVRETQRRVGGGGRGTEL